MVVIFASLRPLERSENIKTVWDAYQGEKLFVKTNYSNEITMNNSLVVTDEFLPNCKIPMIMIFHGIAGGKTYGFDQPRPYHSVSSLDNYLYFVTSSESMVDIVSRQCGVPKGKVLPLGMPRTDLYFQDTERDTKYLPEKKKVYLYVPTFNTLTEKKTDWFKIDSMLMNDEIFVIKNHMVMGDPHIPNDNRLKHIKFVSCNFPSGPFLKGCDVVITDYSSIMFDAYVCNKPVVLYEKDWDIYKENRGMYFEYPERYSDLHTSDEEELVGLLRTADKTDHISKAKEFFAGACDGHSTERLIKLINDIRNDYNSYSRKVKP